MIVNMELARQLSRKDLNSISDTHMAWWKEITGSFTLSSNLHKLVMAHVHTCINKCSRHVKGTMTIEFRLAFLNGL